MGIGFPFRRQKESVVVSEMVVNLTSIGREKAEQFETSGSQAEVLQTLSEKGPSTLKELSDETRIPMDTMKHIIKALIRSQYIKVQRADGDME